MRDRRSMLFVVGVIGLPCCWRLSAPLLLLADTPVCSSNSVAGEVVSWHAFRTF
jgi:hypothetical protein